MTKANLKTIVKASDNGKRFLFLKIKTKGSSETEIVMVYPKDIASKMARIDKAYNENLELFSVDKKIRIVDAIVTSNFNILSYFAQ